MSLQFPNLQSNLHCWTAIGLLDSAQLSANGANEADCRSWKEANLPQDGDKLTHFTQTFAHLLHLVTRHLHSKSSKTSSNLHFYSNLKGFVTFAHLLYVVHWCFTSLTFQIFLCTYIRHTFQMAEDGEKLWHSQQTLTFLCPEEIPRSHSSQIIVFLWTFCFNLRQVAAFLQRSPLSARFNTGFSFMWEEKFYPIIKMWSLKSQSVEKV